MTELAPIKDRDEAEATMGLVTSCQVQLAVEVAAQNAEIQIARKRDKAIADLRNRMTAQVARLGEWAKKDRKSWGECASLELRQGEIGFNPGNKSVMFIQGWTEELTIKALRDAGKKFKDYLSVKYSIARAQILRDVKPEVAKIDLKALKKFGLTVDREESFYCKPKIEASPAPAA